MHTGVEDKGRQHTACVHLAKGPGVNLWVDAAPVTTGLALGRAVLGHKLGRQGNVGKHGVGRHVGLVDDRVGAQTLHLSPGQQASGPGSRGDNHVRHLVEGVLLARGAVEVLDALDVGVCRRLQPRHLGVGAHVDAHLACQPGHGRGEVQGVHLRRLRRAGHAHVGVGADEVVVDPVEVRGEGGVAARVEEVLGPGVLLGQLLPVFCSFFRSSRGRGLGLGGLLSQSLLGHGCLDAAALDASVPPCLGAAVLGCQLGVEAVGQGHEA